MRKENTDDCLLALKGSRYPHIRAQIAQQLFYPPIRAITGSILPTHSFVNVHYLCWLSFVLGDYEKRNANITAKNDVSFEMKRTVFYY